MCSIIQLRPGEMISEEYLFNALHNNEHGYGILLKDASRKKIQVLKDLPSAVDPDKMYKLLKEHDDIDRWVHLRNMSAGEIHMDNVQPIQVYSSNKREVWFMHNGTISNVWVSDKIKAVLNEKLDDKIHSDSKKFAVSKLAPILLRFKGENGFADLTDPFLQDLIEKLWSNTYGRGVLVSNDQPGWILNHSAWETVTDNEGNKFFASNNDYFKEIKRGTLFRQREQEKRDKEAENRKKYPVSVSQIGKGSNIHSLEYPPFQEKFSVSEKMVDILEEFDLFSVDGYIALGFLEQSEIKKLFENNLEDAVIMFMWLTSYLKEMAENLDTLTEEKERAQTLIAQLKRETKTDKVIDINPDTGEVIESQAA